VSDGRPRDPQKLRPGLEDFYREAYRSVFEAALITTRNVSDAEDVTQDTFVEIAKNWPVWASKPWGQKVAHARIAAVRRSIDQHRRGRRLRQVVNRAGPWTGSFTHVESDVMARDLVRLVLEIRAKQERAIAVLAFLQDLSGEMIAQELAIKPSTVRTVIQRLRERFRAAHVEVEVDPGGEQQVGGRHPYGTA